MTKQWIAALRVMALCSLFCGAAWADEVLAPSVKTRLVHFAALPSGPEVPAVFRLPEGEARVPAVVVLHGSGGMDSRGSQHALDLGAAGMATLELDMWGARGLDGGAAGRPKRIHDTMPDLWGALAWLAKQPRVDSSRIGVVGFSWGGAMSMLAATQEMGRPGLAGVPLPQALVAFYPVCWAYNHVPGYAFKQLREVPLLVIVGEQDGYDDSGEACRQLLASLSPEEQARSQLLIFAGATHGFNMREQTMRYSDPFAHRGRGGETLSEANPAAREAARKAVNEFFIKQFAGGNGGKVMP